VIQNIYSNSGGIRPIITGGIKARVVAKDTVTLTLEGDVPVDEFAKAIGYFSALLRALSEEVSNSTPIEWDIARLSGGSATAVVRGTAPDTKAVEKVVIAYGVVGRSLEE